MVVSADALTAFLPTTLSATSFDFLGDRYQGKVRDVYTLGDERFLIATDRQSAFDINWTTIPLKGQVLSQLSAWWFDRIGDIMPTHVIAVPDPNVMVAKKLDMLRIEIVVRGFITGSTVTSAWLNYSKGVRLFCGNILPEGLAKNQRFAAPIITPTTKGVDDEPIDPETIVAHGFATKGQWKEISEKALALFARGQHIANDRGLILVDTKYEMGFDRDGTLTLADEVHTPDSSRYWVKESYERCVASGEEPESLDKEFFRLWLREQGFEYGGKRPVITDDVRLMLAQKYIELYERMTGTPFTLPSDAKVMERIEKNLRGFLASR